VPSVDVDPDAHEFVKALCTVSFKLACGCRIPPGSPADAGHAFIMKHAGSPFPCNKHGEVIITRSSLRLVGWDEPGHHPEGWRP